MVTLEPPERRESEILERQADWEALEVLEAVPLEPLEPQESLEPLEVWGREQEQREEWEPRARRELLV